MRKRRIWRRKEIQKSILTIKDLPDEIVLKILEETDVQDASSFSKIDKFSNQLIKNDNFLMEKVKTYVENMKVCGQEITNGEDVYTHVKISTDFEDNKFRLTLGNLDNNAYRFTFDHFNRFYRCFLNSIATDKDDKFELIVLTYKKIYILSSDETRSIKIKGDENFILSFNYDFRERMAGYVDNSELIYETDKSRDQRSHLLFLNTSNDPRIKYQFKNFYVCTKNDRDIYIILDCPKYRGCIYILYIYQKFPTEDDKESNDLKSLINEVDIDFCNNFIASKYFQNNVRNVYDYYQDFFNVIYDVFEKVFDKINYKFDYQKFDQIQQKLLEVFKKLS
jgi:hypothetical protein